MKLLALDIDGTTVRHGESAPRPEVTGAIRALSELGVIVILASGRMFPGTAAVARQLGLRTPLICQQGCGVHDPQGNLTHSFPIARSTALELVAMARELEHPYEWFNPLRYLVSRKTSEALEYARLSGIEAEFRPDPENSDVEPTGVGILSNDTEARGIHRVLTAAFDGELHVLDFPTVTVAVSARASKGHALALLCEDLGVDRSDVVAVGDSVNDAPMLAWAGRGFAMASSDHYALQAADEVLPDAPDALGTLLESFVRLLGP